MGRATKNAGACMAAFALLALASCGSSTDSAKPGSGGTTGATTGQTTAGTTASGKASPYVTLQKQIPEVMKANAIPGVVVLIKSKESGDWQQPFGTAEIGKTVPMKMDDLFRIGSNTKTMTSTVILQLVQEGKLKLDDPISKYYPGVPNGDQITITQLSDMRSGLYSYTFDKAFNETLDKDPQKAWTPEELLNIGLSKPVNFAPGTQYEYSNTNIVLLGVVIEKLTGMSATEAFQKRIFEPLKLKNTSLPKNTESTIPGPHAQGYQFLTNVETIESYAVPPAQLPAALDGSLEPLNYTDANPSWAWTAGGAISTPDELATYVKAMVGGGLLDEKTQKIRLDSIIPNDPSQPNGTGYGLGLVRFAPNVYGHDGQIPGYSTFMTYDPAKDITIIIGTNLAASPLKGENAAVVIGKVVMSELYGAAGIPGGDPAAAAGGGASPGTTTAGATGTTKASR